ncbi:MAG: trehalose-phosphatase [Acidobacteria bacterium]|nr:trehalose-phosphatase [Acidobacteriota bacterium]
MAVASHSDVCAAFFDRLRGAPSRALLVDYDGTLAPFTPDRNRAFPYRGIPELLSKISGSGTRVVLISGRPASELVFLLGIDPHPEIWGVHGRERLMPDGTYLIDPPSPEHENALRLIARSLEEAGLSSRMEIKPGGLAVHWRGLRTDQREPIEAEVGARFGAGSNEHGLELIPFDGGLELGAPGRNKGDAVSAILVEAGQGVAAAYLGDDQTDENAFRAIKGRGFGILVGPEPRPTMADTWLRPPVEVARFLSDWLLACGAGG